ncbi:xanthine dehydrogenase family protein molybdopterin-binding subunit [Intestinimonas sp. HCP28S3_D6]|uniref:xanthine dehydrogenase family protein molybdopterin-binding subunit n=1 Tax=Intestinimonas sp. HCP28S3_D6 TaxID=3438942 RepID=UPI003F8914FB
MRYVNKAIPKTDGMALTSGKGLYTDDLAPRDCLVVKVLRSPYAFARIKSIRKETASRVTGIACILTWEDVPKIRYTLAGQSYPEPSPYDRYILDQVVRYVGDPVAIVAGRDEASVDKAMRMIQVKYEVLEPVIDFEKALDNPSVIHPESDYHTNFNIGGDPSRNLVSSGCESDGDVEAALAGCDVVVDRTYYTKANAQAMMETFSTYTWLDQTGRLNVTSSTQVPFHCRRIIAHALGLPQGAVRVTKPRIGGGFGAKQTLVSELFPALVTLRTGRPAKIVYTRREVFQASNSRHQMRVHVRVGAMRDGTIKAVDMHALSNAGAYGEHASTTVGLVGHKNIPLYAKDAAFRFTYEVVYTNTMAAGAYRGYGATQGCFAMESAVNELAAQLGMDPAQLRLKNLPQQGMNMPAYYNEPLSSSCLPQCIQRGMEMIGWAEKYPSVRVDDRHVRGVGMAITMQGSGISAVDTATVTIKLNDDGFYTLMIGATDMGTGCDTILAQMAAEVLECPMEWISVAPIDTDYSPYDTGSYASSTTYVTGTAVVKACTELVEKITSEGARRLGIHPERARFDGQVVYDHTNPDTRITLAKLGQDSVVGPGSQWLTATASHCSPTSPPPLMAGFAEVEADLETGEVKVVDYVGVVDCGTVVNKNLARIQAEGGIAQGIGMALFEDVCYDGRGMMANNSFLQYKIPSRTDLPQIRVEFEESYEPNGPFGAKSIGEVVINTPAPAVAHAIRNATGVQVRDLPITAEKLVLGMAQNREETV